MILHLQDEVRLNQPQSDGASLQSHYRVYAEAEGIDPDDYVNQQREADEFPERLIWLWETFIDLSGSRQLGASGPNPIAFSEMVAWGLLFAHEFTIWEVDALRSLDTAWLNAIAKGQKNGNGSKTSPRH